MKGSLLPDGLISRAIREGLELRKKLLADGTPVDETDRIVGHALRKAWEVSTKRIGHDDDVRGFYRCGKCSDTGWVNVPPSYMEQKQLSRLYGENAQSQGFITKCDPCPWNEDERRKRREVSGDEEGLVGAGRTKRSGRKF